jgi:hypothetical protein
MNVLYSKSLPNFGVEVYQGISTRNTDTRKIGLYAGRQCKPWADLN